MPELWVPGAGGPSLGDFIERILRQIGTFAERIPSRRVHVEAELHDGAVLTLHSISAEPGYGLVTLRPYPDDAQEPWPSVGEAEVLPPQEIMVPLGSIMRITLSEAEGPRGRPGFSLESS
jgi:hypothetical protein